MMSALIYTKFILSIAYIVGFYRHLQFYTAQASHFKINILLFAENCLYVLLAFVSLWTLFEKEGLYQKMLRVIGIYAFVSLSLFALYVFKGTLSSVEYWCAILSQIFNILIIGRMYVFKPDENSKKLNKRKVSLDSHLEETHPSLSFESSFGSKINQKPPEISQAEALRTQTKQQMMASFSAHSFDRDVRKVRSFNPAKKTKFKRLKKFDLKKV